MLAFFSNASSSSQAAPKERCSEYSAEEGQLMISDHIKGNYSSQSFLKRGI